MKKTALAIAFAGVAALTFLACSDSLEPTAPSRTVGRGLPSYVIGIASSGQQQVCLDGISPANVTYWVDLSNVTGLTGTEDVQPSQAITPGNCIMAIQEGLESDNPPGSGIYLPAVLTPVITANVPGTWSYTCSIDPSVPPTFCPDPSSGNANTGTVKSNVYHGSLIMFHFTPAETPCPAGNFSSMFNGAGDLLIEYDQFPAPNDNSYGINAVGWPSGRNFGALVGSDHAGFQIKDANGIVKLSFNVDYISQVNSAPSGYASLGVTGGDGDMLVGTSWGITATTSLANNLNNINIPGLFSSSHAQQLGSVNVLVNSPPTDPAHSTYNISDPALMGWDFHNTYFVTISAAKLASIGFNAASWKVEPNASQLHNSPAKPCPVAGGACQLTVTKWEVKDRQVKVTVMNGANTAAYLTQLSLTWPSATNGKLMKVKMDGDVVYDSPDISGGSTTLTLVELVADQNKRKINKTSSDVITFEFENNVDIDLANYTANLVFGDCPVVLLPH
jgi:hypothetical protein